MKRMLLSILLCVCVLLSLVPQVSALKPPAQDITKSTTITGTGYKSFSFLKDNNKYIYHTSEGETKITLRNDNGMYSIYLLFNIECGEYQVEDHTTGEFTTAGKYGFLHEYIPLKGKTTAITLHFPNEGIQLSEIYVFGTGRAPDYVQQWQPPLEGKTDLMLLSAHGDDEQLFFAGLLPYYAGQRRLKVQVVYMTDHRNITLERTHEMLNGLWGSGVTAYPVFGSFRDIRIDDLEELYIGYATYGVKKSAFVDFVVENIRRFKPKVIVGHDINGEYGHGMHQIYTDCLMDALELTSDPAHFPDSAAKYGTWDVPKTYLHLYEENPIVMNYDLPLSEFNGLTAFQVTQKYGFSQHKSQHKYWFYQWLYGENGEITKASQIETYSPCQFGLFRTTVGPDVRKIDFMENLTTQAEDERLEQERLEQERLEQERLEQERLEQERLEREKAEKERVEKEQLEQELAALMEHQRQLEQEKQQLQSKNTLLWIAIIASGLLMCIILYLLIAQSLSSKRKKRRKIRK